MSGTVEKVKLAVSDLMIDDIQDAVRSCLAEGVEPLRIIREGMSEGMMVVGERFQSGEYFLADLILAGETMKEGMMLLKDRISAEGAAGKGTVILATVHGDIHEIGKNIVGIMLTAAGYRVIDLGVDVSPARIVEEIGRTGAHGLGLSCLLTTMIESIAETVQAVSRAGLRDRVKIAIGGACVSERLASEMGVDAYGADAVQAIRIFSDMPA
jgi:methanogenic corrinoid protein MtbC1